MKMLVSLCSTRRVQTLLAALVLTMACNSAALAEVVTVGIGIQNTTTNTVTGGIVIEKLGLLDKYIPQTGRHKDIQFELDWQNFTSGPPVTNGMIANKLQIGMMGDYPLPVNGANFQASPANKEQLM